MVAVFPQFASFNAAPRSGQNMVDPLPTRAAQPGRRRIHAGDRIFDTFAGAIRC